MYTHTHTYSYTHTQVRRSILKKYTRIDSDLSKFDMSGDFATPLQREQTLADMQQNLLAVWRTNNMRTNKPSPEDEARYGLSVIEETLWDAVPEHYVTIDDALHRIGQPALPIDCKLITLGSWMGGDRDGNPFVTHQVARRIVYHMCVVYITLSHTSSSGDAAHRVPYVCSVYKSLTHIIIR